MATPKITNLDNVNKTYMADGVQYALDPSTNRFAIASTIKPVPNATIQNASPITIPPTNISQLPQQLPQTQDYTNAQAENKTVEQNLTQQNLDLLKLYNEASGRSADQLALEQQQGIPQISQKVLDLQALADQKALEYNLTPYSLAGQGRGITTGILRGQEEVKQRQLAVEGIFANAQLKAAQGNLQLAQSQVDRALSLKYDPILAKIDAQKQIIENSKFMLSRSDKKLADAKQAELDRQKQEIADKKENEKAVNKLIIDASPVAPADVLQRAKDIQANGGSATEVAMALGKYGGDYLGDLVKRSTIAKNNADYDKTMKEIKLLGQAPQITAPAGTNANFIQNLAASAVNKESLVAGEREKITKSFAVTQQLGALAQNLQKDQTSFAGGKVREIMAALGQDKDAGLIQAQITALVPQVARGIFGEVGVLTNQDTQNYKKVIGNLTSPNDQNKAVTAMTLIALRNGVKSQLEVAAASKLDVSRFAPLYQDLTNQINTINDEIGYSDVQVKEYADLNPQLKPMIEQLIIEGRKGSEILQIIGVEN